MKILIISPEIHRLGGVANHYLGLSSHWTFNVEYIFYGKRTDSMSTWKVLLLYPFDFLRCLFKIIFCHIDVVIINPSLRTAQLFRDGLFLLLARSCGKPVVTFIHGFDVDLANKFAKKKGLFQWCYNKSSFIYTLYSGFKELLQNAGIKCPILLTSTKVANELLSDVELEERKNIKNILFVARIIKQKGIFIAIKTFEQLKLKYPYLTLTICGDGPDLVGAKEYVLSHQISDVTFKGNVSGNSLRDEYIKGDLYILPTYSEGMATTILESMAFGLPFITRPTGGVIDFYTKDMGYLVDSFDPSDYVREIETLIKNPTRISEISRFNMKYAKEHFMADKVTAKFENDILTYIKGK